MIIRACMMFMVVGFCSFANISHAATAEEREVIKGDSFELTYTELSQWMSSVYGAKVTLESVTANYGITVLPIQINQFLGLASYSAYLRTVYFSIGEEASKTKASCGLYLKPAQNHIELFDCTADHAEIRNVAGRLSWVTTVRRY